MTPEVRAYLVRGRVQGVGFRWWTARAARRLSLAGTVRNRDDGTVEIVASGPPDRLEAFERQVRSGPPGSSVTALEPLEPLDPPADPPTGDFVIVG